MRADHVDAGARAAGELQPGGEEGVAGAAVGGGRVEEGARVPVEAAQHQRGDQQAGAEQQHHLQDLDEGGALHAADRRVTDHQRAHADDAPGLHRLAGEAQDEPHQLAGAGELDQHQRQQRGEGDDAGGDPHRAAARHAAGQRVAHGETARVAQGFGQQEHQQHQGQGGAQREHDAVVAEEGDDAARAEDGRRGDVVTGDGEAVAQRGEGAVAGVERVEVVPVGAGQHAQQQSDRGDRGEPHQGHGLGGVAELRVHRAASRRASTAA